MGLGPERNDSYMTHVIIGSGAAGMAAAKTIRDIDPGAKIVVITEDDAIYSRCMLHQYISGERDDDRLSFVTAEDIKKLNIDLLCGSRVSRIDTANGKVFYNGGEVAYDRLLIATGSNSFVPPVGSLRDANNVYGLKNYADAVNIKEGAKNAENVVIIGAGLIGLDAAYPLVRAGKKVSVVELVDSVLSVNLDRRAAKAYQERFEQAGCKFYLGKKAADTVIVDGKVTSVILDDGQELKSDMIVVAVGVRPAVGFLEGSGIKVDKSIVVDPYLETSVKGVYAAGDVAGLSGIWPNAAAQGRAAARNMCGENEEYTDLFATKNTINFFELVSMSLGKLEPEEGDTVEVFERRGVYKKAIITGDTLTGVILQGDISNSGHWQQLIKKKAALKGRRPVFKTSFADYFNIEEDGAYAWPESV